MAEIQPTRDEMEIRRLGKPIHPSPLDLPPAVPGASGSFMPEGIRVRYRVDLAPGGGEHAEDAVSFEKAGPRERIFFDPPATRAALVTCGGLCPGVNNVIRSAYYQLYHRYGVRDVLGIRYGFLGLTPDGPEPIPLTPRFVAGIHNLGGTALGSSRGPQPIGRMVDFLEQRGIDILLCVGGDGTQRGAHAIAEEARARGLALSVVGVPKTIDNDIPFVWRSFGFFTALEKAREVIQGAHVEACGTPYGVGLVKLMGRYAGFIAAGATLASQEVNFCLIPEVPFALEGEGGFLDLLERRLRERGHAVVVVAEGAGQDLLGGVRGTDASGNLKLADIGVHLKERIGAFCRERGIPASIKYFDPSYLIRSVPANTADSLLCDSMARHAVHAAMAGHTDVLVGYWHNAYVHVPIPAVTRRTKRLESDGGVWTAVLEATGQPRQMGQAVERPGHPAVVPSRR
ncbi:MAG TPA: ATP-dependent 6-phosphofructokinase [Thermoanaerobaculia bacterium]|nr:ATP-dependent 6-phosphofructokinase [Thermoanaerobaculia bacterium]